MAEYEPTPGLAEAERLYGQPQVRICDLGEVDDAGFWDTWRRRTAEVVLVLRRPDGRVILQTKGYYPPGIFRLPSGGIVTGENLLGATRRETREETGLAARIERFLGIVQYRTRRRGEPVALASHVFLLDAGTARLCPRDVDEQISAFREVPVAELPAVARQLEGLAGRWAMWGRFRALVHWFVADAMPATPDADRQTSDRWRPAGA